MSRAARRGNAAAGTIVSCSASGPRASISRRTAPPGSLGSVMSTSGPDQHDPVAAPVPAAPRPPDQLGLVRLVRLERLVALHGRGAVVVEGFEASRPAGQVALAVLGTARA